MPGTNDSDNRVVSTELFKGEITLEYYGKIVTIKKTRIKKDKEIEVSQNE